MARRIIARRRPRTCRRRRCGGRDGAPERQLSRLLGGLGGGELGQDGQRALGVVLLHFHVLEVEVEARARDAVVALHRLGEARRHDVVDGLRGDVAAAERLQRALALQLEQLVLLDDRRGQVLGVEDLLPAPAQPLAQPHVEEGMGGLLAPDGVVAAFFHDEGNERPLLLQILVRRRVAAHGNDLPRGVAEGVEEEGALLADDVADLLAGELAVRHHAEQPVVQPGMRVLGFLQQARGEVGGGQGHGIVLRSEPYHAPSRRGASALFFFAVAPSRPRADLTLVAVNQLGFGTIVPVIALYARSFDVSQSAIGLAIAAYGLARFLVAVPAGSSPTARTSRRAGRRRHRHRGGQSALRVRTDIRHLRRRALRGRRRAPPSC
jgi:hypothetical protein